MVIKRKMTKYFIPTSPLFGWAANLPKTKRQKILKLAVKRFGKRVVISRLSLLTKNWKLIDIKRKAIEDIKFVKNL